MYLNAACGSSRAAHFIHNLSQTQIQPDGTWSLRTTLFLPCTLMWKWRADDMWEQGSNREERLPARKSIILSTFGGEKHESEFLHPLPGQFFNNHFYIWYGKARK